MLEVIVGPEVYVAAGIGSHSSDGLAVFAVLDLTVAVDVVDIEEPADNFLDVGTPQTIVGFHEFREVEVAGSVDVAPFEDAHRVVRGRHAF